MPLSSDNYTVLSACYTHDEDGFAYFEVETASSEAIDADDALGSDGVLNFTAIRTSILNACLDADEAR